MLAVLFIGLVSNQAWCVDCSTSANDTWDCGTPGTSDNLVISHTVTISGNWNSTGNITIRDGGSLTINGNLTATSNRIKVEDGVLNVTGNVVINDNSEFEVYGIFHTDGSVAIRAGAIFYLKGATTVNGNIAIDPGSTFLMKKDSDVLVLGDFANNASATEVDGVLTIDQSLINNNLISGVGEISYISCSGTGLINDLNAATYCSSSPIDMISSHCSANDSEPPTFITFPNNITAYAPEDECAASVLWAIPNVDDNCSVDDLIASHRPGSKFDTGNTTVTYTLSDKAGNTAQQSFMVTVLDTISPAITGMPDKISVDAELSTCGTTVTWSEPNVMDNCAVILSSDFTSGSFFPIGEHTITYTASDLSGNNSRSSFDIEVTNPHIPIFAGCPSDKLVYTSKENCVVRVQWTEPTVSGCGISVVQSHKPGDTFTIGMHEVTYTATDISNNTVSCTFNVQVIDTIPPEFTNCPTTYEIVSIDSMNEKAIVIWDDVKAEDKCSAVTIKSSHQPGDSFDFGTTPVTFTATDAVGNEAICILEIKVGINNPPSVASQQLSTMAAEALEICLKASDPDGDQIKLSSINIGNNGGQIADVDSLGLCFVYRANNMFEGTENIIVEVVDDGLPNMYGKAEIIISVRREHTILPSSAITPNGDEINDLWVIQNIDLYPENTVRIFDRWGGVIYQVSAYDNISRVWNGKNESGEIVSSGSYFYVIDLGTNSEKITGPIEVIE